MNRELLQQIVVALKALMTGYVGDAEDAIYAIEKELAQPEQWGDSAISDPVVLNAQKDINGAIRQLVQTEQEPVKCTCGYSINHPLVSSCSCKLRKEWVGLTDDEVDLILWQGVFKAKDIRAIETKLKEKNGAT